MARLSDTVIEEAAEQLDLPEEGWRRRRLARKLRELAEHDLSIFKSRNPVRQQARLRETLARIEHAAAKRPFKPARVRRLLERHPLAANLVRFQVASAIEPGDEQSALQDGSADAQLREIVEVEPERLRGAVSTARACVEAKIAPGRGGVRHGEDESFKDVVRLLGDVYWEVTGQAPASSLGRREPGGPFVRLLLAVLPHLDDRWRFKTRDALHNEVQRLKRSGAWAGLQPKNSPAKKLD